MHPGVLRKSSLVSAALMPLLVAEPYLELSHKPCSQSPFSLHAVFLYTKGGTQKTQGSKKLINSYTTVPT